MAADERESPGDLLHDSGTSLSRTTGSGSAMPEGSGHPVGTGVGRVGGAVVGAAAGMAAGPLGMAVGGVAGAVVGGLAGRAVAEVVNADDEEAHWRRRYTQEPYYEPGRGFDDYGPAYRYGMETRSQTQEDWDTAASRLELGWAGARGTSSLDWERARPASRAAWDRVDQTLKGSRTVGPTGGHRDGSRSTGTGATASAGAMGTGMATGTAGTAPPAGNAHADREDIIDVLNDLVECCKDGEYGFRSCADSARRADLKALFQQRAEDCLRSCRELQERVRQLGGEAGDSGSTLGAVHRGWVSVKSTLSTSDDQALLKEAERGEDNALARYRKAMRKPLPSDLRPILERQLQDVQRNHDEIKRLREQLRAAS